MTVCKFCSLLDKLSSLSGAVVLAPLHLRPSHHSTKQQLVQLAYKNSMHLNSQVIEEMRWWHDEMHQWSGKAIIPAKCQMVVTTNTSSFN